MTIFPLLSWLMLKGRCRDCQQNQQALSVGGVIDGTGLFCWRVWSGRKVDRALAVMMLSTWLMPQASLTSITDGCRCFYSGRIVRRD
ncbi:prepilin peptidase [Escherichia coli]